MKTGGLYKMKEFCKLLGKVASIIGILVGLVIAGIFIILMTCLI